MHEFKYFRARASIDMDQKNVLVIGCGNLGRWHVKGLETAAGAFLLMPWTPIIGRDRNSKILLNGYH